ncbi:hypothetical protein BU14_0152s0008 [Porphyra umbilicalis]|uniref:Acyl carrier protein n=1 Tax=Porphyra umbilicalis TaxID=2786 RepID=A0A1X6P9L8_PORUM|nr:hypothetical protein BU14_0152s0008 [Porphyra umbilicalis]|eukprot:OSX77313.1 hypothetical protein BU14_0152s0008 [Porphyra umbilicalis]
MYRSAAAAAGRALATARAAAPAAGRLALAATPRATAAPAAMALSVAAGPAVAGPAGVGRWAGLHTTAWAGEDASAPVGYLDKASVTERVLDVVKKFEKVDAAKVTPDSHFTGDLGLDSLDTVELVMGLEDEFAIEIADESAEKIVSVADAVDFIAGNANAK